MTPDIPLRPTGIATGLFLILIHAVALVFPAKTKQALKLFPRSRLAGTVLLFTVAAWSLFLIRTMDLGEFTPMRNLMTFAILGGTILSWQYVEEFLSIRALGMLALLAADPLLCATYMRSEPTRLLLVVLAYAWIIAGLFWVGIPWILRDQIAWVSQKPLRWKIASLAGIAYGMALLILAIVRW